MITCCNPEESIYMTGHIQDNSYEEIKEEVDTVALKRLRLLFTLCLLPDLSNL